MHSRGIFVFVKMASAGAAQLPYDGRMAYFALKISITVYFGSTCNNDSNSWFAYELMHAKLHMWDDFVMIGHHNLEPIDRKLKIFFAQYYHLLELWQSVSVTPGKTSQWFGQQIVGWPSVQVSKLFLYFHFSIDY